MPRPKTYSEQDVAERAMHRFWRHGYQGSAISDLVEATGVNRHGLYSSFGDKQGLFRAAAAHYTDQVVTPAFAPVEAPGAGLSEIRAYFEDQIKLAEDAGLPGPGCLMANAMTETGPHDPEVAALVLAHMERLAAGFRNALSETVPAKDRWREARFLMISAQGLWSVSRMAEDAAPLRDYVDCLMSRYEGWAS